MSDGNDTSFSIIPQPARSGEVIGVPRFNEGDFIRLTANYMTRDIGYNTPTVMAIAGTVGFVASEPSPDDKGGYEYRVALAERVDEAPGFTGWSSWVPGNILELYTPDEFEKAWLLRDYKTARALYEATLR